jgi:hypothetical protein
MTERAVLRRVTLADGAGAAARPDDSVAIERELIDAAGPAPDVRVGPEDTVHGLRGTTLLSGPGDRSRLLTVFRGGPVTDPGSATALPSSLSARRAELSPTPTGGRA